MECPHCQSEITVTPHVFALGEDQDGTWQISSARCSACDRLIVNVCRKDGPSYPAWPQSSTRPRLSEDVPADYADDYHAATRVFIYSPESTAALSRRLLQRILASKADAAEGGLVDQIRRVVMGQDMPEYLKRGLRTYTRLAKLDSEPGMSHQPEALATVYPGEAEWLLDVLQSLFELYFVQPARLQRKQDSLEQLIAPPLPPAVGLAPEASTSGAEGAPADLGVAQAAGQGGSAS